jgi:hypothetical protein
MKLSLIEKEMPGKVRDIWMDYHKNKFSNVAYCLSDKEYMEL